MNGEWSTGGRVNMLPALLVSLLVRLAASSSILEEAPILREHPSNVVVPRNDPVTLNCAATGAARFRWFRDGDEVTTSPQDPRAHRILLNTGSLFFLHVSANKRDSDAGTYWCVASNRYGSTRSRNATLTVATLDSKFQRVADPLVKALVGDTVTLPCRPPGGTPPPEITWMRDGNKVSNSSRLNITQDGDLVITSVVERDSATYTCRARNAAGTREAPGTTLTVMTPPWFEERPGNVTTASGVVVGLPCRAQGSPSPQVTWRRLDGKMPLGRATLEEHRLVLREVTSVDSGVYLCEAKSEAGRVTARATLTVADAPELTQRLQHLQVMAGDDLKVSCRVKGQPQPTTVWRLPTQDRTALLLHGQSRDRASISKDGHTLLLKHTTPEDSGTYYCWGVSRGGGVSGWAEVVVLLGNPPPVMGVGPQDQIVAPGGVANFRCEVVSEAAAAQVTWTFQSAPHLLQRPLTHEAISADPRLSLPDNGALIIKDVNPEDAGIYNCRVEAVTGSVEKSASLQVSEDAADEESLPVLPAPPTKPRVVVLNGTAVHLSWLPNSQEGGKMMQWYSVEYWRQGWPEWRLAEAVITQESCVVDQLTDGQTYTFLVRAVNSRGASFPSPWSDPVTVRRRAESSISSDQVRDARRRLARPVIALTGALATAPDRVLLTWEFLDPSESGVEGVLVYSVEEGGVSGVQVTTVLGGTSSSSHEVHGLQPFTPYIFFVAPFWRSVEGTPSNSYHLTTPEDVPVVAPKEVVVSRTGESSFRIEWLPLESANTRGKLLGYRVTLSNNGSHISQIARSPWLEATTSLLPGRLYTVRVAALTGAGTGPSSDPVLLDTRISDQALEVKDGGQVSVLYAPPQPAWLAYLLVPVVIVVLLVTVYYVRRLRRKAPPSKPPHEPSLYQDPSFCPDHHSVNMYSEHKPWRPPGSDKDSSEVTSTYLMRPNLLANEYAEPRVQQPNDDTEPYATTALLAPPSPSVKQGPPWRHQSEDSGVEVNWAAILPPPPTCPPPLDLGDFSACCRPYKGQGHGVTTQCRLLRESDYEHPDTYNNYGRIATRGRPTDMATFSSLDSGSSVRSSSCSSRTSCPASLRHTRSQ